MTRIEEIKKLVEPYLRNEPELAATLLRNVPEIEKYGLGQLVYLLSKGEYGCHRNDVIGVLELLEAHMAKES